MRTPLLVSIAFTAAAATTAAAQARLASGFETAPRAELAAAHPLLADTLPGAHADSVRGSRTERVLSRTGLAAIGWVGGAFMGAMIGRTLDTSGGEDPGLVGTVLGVALGSTLGSGIGAAAPNYGSHCTFGQRLTNGVLGAVAGAAAGGALASGVDTDGAVLVIPFGSVVGAGLAVGC